ncbi:MAG TPA: protein kinase [Myxococcota bacterium]|nr:protein kinase [Myxococcota bacterium]HQP94928.1 protein kinase [Myxococcota bacterium]
MKGVEGEIVGGRYVIGRQVGSGGFGTVFLGRQINLDREVAIKVMRRGPEEPAVARERFRREAILSSGLSHPNIVTCHDFLVDDDDDLILVMEYLRGVTMDRILAASGRMEPGRVADLVAGVAAGLGECHRCGIVHRDIKPSNIFIIDEGTTRERAKIIDFGILWAMPDFDGGLPELTRANAFIGTPEYVAPEVLFGALPDGGTDQYALALVVLRAVTGQLPFPDSKGAALLKRLTDRPPLLDHEVMRAWPTVRGVLFKALSPDPGDRFEDIDQFGSALADAADVGRRAAQAGSVTTETVVELNHPGLPCDSSSAFVRASNNAIVEDNGEAADISSQVEAISSQVEADGTRPSAGHRIKWLALLFALVAVGFGTGVVYLVVSDAGARTVSAPAGHPVVAAVAPDPSEAEEDTTPPVSSALPRMAAPETTPEALAPSPVLASEPPVDKTTSESVSKAARTVKTEPVAERPRTNRPDVSRKPSTRSPSSMNAGSGDTSTVKRPSPDPLPAVEPVQISQAIPAPAPAVPTEVAPSEETALIINAEPFGQVTYDGRRMGQTPVVIESPKPGQHTVEVVSASNVTIRRVVTVEEGKRKVEFFSLD